MFGFGLERRVCLLCFDGIMLRRNARVGNVGRKLEGFLIPRFPCSSSVLEVLSSFGCEKMLAGGT
jgi:hypothetical protein